MALLWKESEFQFHGCQEIVEYEVEETGPIIVCPGIAAQILESDSARRPVSILCFLELDLQNHAHNFLESLFQNDASS